MKHVLIGLAMVTVMMYGCKLQESGKTACAAETFDCLMLAGSQFVAAHQNGTPIMLAFDASESRFHGRVANAYFGSYTIDRNGIRLRMSQVASSMMMGPPAAMEAEGAYFKFLRKVKTFALDGDTLTLKADDGETLTFNRQ